MSGDADTLIHRKFLCHLWRSAGHGDLRKHLGIDLSTDLDGDLCKHLGILDDRYSNLFLNAYINLHAHTEYLKMI